MDAMRPLSLCQAEPGGEAVSLLEPGRNRVRRAAGKEEDEEEEENRGKQWF